MRIDARKIGWRLAHYGALIGVHLVAMAQFWSPAAAADPASRIDPPAWSHTHSRSELQAYGQRAQAEEPEMQTAPARFLRRQRRASGAPNHAAPERSPRPGP